MKKMEDIVGLKIKKVGNLLERYMLGVKAKIEKEVGETKKKISAMQGQIMMYLYHTGKKNRRSPEGNRNEVRHPQFHRRHPPRPHGKERAHHPGNKPG